MIFSCYPPFKHCCKELGRTFHQLIREHNELKCLEFTQKCVYQTIKHKCNMEQ